MSVALVDLNIYCTLSALTMCEKDALKWTNQCAGDVSLLSKPDPHESGYTLHTCPLLLVFLVLLYPGGHVLQSPPRLVVVCFLLFWFASTMGVIQTLATTNAYNTYAHSWKSKRAWQLLAAGAGCTGTNRVNNLIWSGVGCGPLRETVIEEQ